MATNTNRDGAKQRIPMRQLLDDIYADDKCLWRKTYEYLTRAVRARGGDWPLDSWWLRVDFNGTEPKHLRFREDGELWVEGEPYDIMVGQLLTPDLLNLLSCFLDSGTELSAYGYDDY